MKILISFLLIFIVTIGQSRGGSYYLTAQVGIEDRMNGDYDANDAIFTMKAIFKQDNGIVPEFTVIVNPLAYGAKDDLEVRLDVSRYPGTCSDAAITDGKACRLANETWTPSSGQYYLHTKSDVVDLSLGVDGVAGTADDWIIYKDVTEMFAACPKTELINTTAQVKDCDGQPVVLTIIDSNLSYGTGLHGPEAIACSNCSGSQYTVTSQFDFNHFLEIRNKTQGNMTVGWGNTDTIISTIDMGFPIESTNWYDAYLGGHSEVGHDGGGNLLNLDDCDPKVTTSSTNPSETECKEAMEDWFRNKTVNGWSVSNEGIDAAFVASNSKLMGASLSSPNFAIGQINGGTATNPVFGGPKWDPKDASTMILIDQYFNEQGNTIGVNHTQVRLKRLLCDMIDCSGIGLGSGTLATGDSCTGGHECQSGFCDFSGGNPGVCGSPPVHTQSVSSCTWSGAYNGTTPDVGCNLAYPICRISGTECSNGQPGAPCNTGTDCVSTSCDYTNFVCF